MRFVARKLFQLVGLQPLAKGLVDDGAMVAGFFFLLVDKGCDVLADECCQPRGIGGVFLLVHVALPPFAGVGQQGAQGSVIGAVATFAQDRGGLVGGIEVMAGSALALGHVLGFQVHQVADVGPFA